MNQRPSLLGYLPALDGVRALAVMAVIVYHANKKWLGGGFLGVEVFFVISGFLISSLLIAESQRDGTIDLTDLALLMNNYGKTGALAGDLNGDRRVDDADVRLFSAQYKF